MAASIVAFQGSVLLQKDNNSPAQQITTASLIQLGDSLQTAQNSNVSIAFADGSKITLHENSQAVFDHLSAYGDSGMVDSRLRLFQGRVDSKVHPAVGVGSRFEIHTPSAISAVRGTEYRLSSGSNNATTHLEVLHGKVAIAAEKQTIVVPQGHGSRVAQGQAPIAARELLAAPILADIPARIRQLNWLNRR